MQTVGIDLGTTNTVLARNASVLSLGHANGRPAAHVPGHEVLPSVLAFPPDGGRLVGSAARDRRSIDAKNTIFSAKRIIGEKWHSYRAAQFREHYPFDLVEGSDGGVEFNTRAGRVSPTEVGAAVVGAAVQGAGLELEGLSAVVTVPASFSLAQAEATRRAVAMAGFDVVRCVTEPIASAIAYLDRSSTIRYSAVFDLGGGTFDLAVLDCREKPLSVIAYGGDPYLGGDDVDRAIARSVVDEVLRTRRWDLGASSQVFERLVIAAERAKIELRRKEKATIDLSWVDEAAPRLGPIDLDRARVWRLSAKLIGRAFRICDEVLSDAGLRAQDLQAVFLAGGATLMPGVREAVSEYFGRKVRTDLDPMHVVSIGASLAAARPALSGLLD